MEPPSAIEREKGERFCGVGVVHCMSAPAGDHVSRKAKPSRRLPPPDWACSLQGIFHFQLGRGEPMLHTRLRPHCKGFLEKIAKLYELHVFTFGSRLYAHTIAGERAAGLSPRTGHFTFGFSLFLNVS